MPLPGLLLFVCLTSARDASSLISLMENLRLSLRESRESVSTPLVEYRGCIIATRGSFSSASHYSFLHPQLFFHVQAILAHSECPPGISALLNDLLSLWTPSDMPSLLNTVRHSRSPLNFLPGVETFLQADPETPLVSWYIAFEKPVLIIHSFLSVHPLAYDRNTSPIFEERRSAT